jgi:O-antigen chain-terminating methyltransferase
LDDPLLLTPGQVTANLQSIESEMQALRSEIERDEPRPASLNVRSRLGYYLKDRLYRLLWWQKYQLRKLVEVLLRRDREEISAIERLSRALEQAHRLVLDCRRQVKDNEIRLRQLESSQAKFQIAEREREELSQRQESLLQHVSALSNNFRSEGAKLAQLERRSQETAARLSELGLFAHQTRTALSMHDRRLSLFAEEARRRLPEPFDADQCQKVIKAVTEHKYDSLYVEFEQAFRGSTQEIKNRQTVYLPILEEHTIGSAEMPVLDLGCGRGEWLELLREHGLHAAGLDSNDSMVQECRSAGLDVTQGDALSYLRSLPDASKGGVTSFHMVEHLPFEVTLTLIDEVLRVLKPGGIIILETPNPSNLFVGAHTFYLDPSHIKPLPSAMLRFFVEARGFIHARVLELNPCPEAMLLPDDDNGIGKRLNEYFYGPRDYAVVGRKP